MTNETTTTKMKNDVTNLAVPELSASARKRRTPAEVKADLQARIKEIEERQAAVVLRLVEDARTTLKTAAAMEAAKPHAAVLAGVIKALDPLVPQVPKQ